MSNLAFINDNVTKYEAIKTKSGWEIVTVYQSGKREPWWYATNQKRFYASLDEVHSFLSKASIDSFTVIVCSAHGLN